MAYFSNSTDGDRLQQQCDTCIAGREGACCPVRIVQDLYNYDQLDKGQEKLKEAMEVLIDKEGICQMRPIINLDTPVKNDVPSWLYGEQP